MTMRARSYVVGSIAIITAIFVQPSTLVAMSQVQSFRDSQSQAIDLNRLDWQAMIGKSDAIVLGEVVQQKNVLTGLGRPHVITESTIKITDSILGTNQVGTTIHITTQGGEYTDVVTQAPMIEWVSHEAKLETGKKYLLFLELVEDTRRPIFTKAEATQTGINKITIADGDHGKFTVVNGLVQELGVTESAFKSFLSSRIQ